MTTRKGISLLWYAAGSAPRRAAHVLSAAVLSVVINSVGHAQSLPAATPIIADVEYSQTLRLGDGGETVTRRSWEILRDAQGRMRVDWGTHALIADPVQRLYFEVNVEKRTINRRQMTQPGELAVMAPTSATPPNTSSTTPAMTPLGTKVIDGLLCEGMLVSQSLEFESGEFDEPIRVETEIWTAVELRMPVLVTQSNSLGQHTRYALTNVRLEEPSPEEFRPPAGFVDVPRRTVGLEDVAVTRPGVGLP